MDAGWVLHLGKHTLETALMVSAPILLVCMTVGIIVSLFQAVTSLRDMTLTMVPKLIGVGLTAMVFGNWMLQILMKFTIEIFGQIENITH